MALILLVGEQSGQGITIPQTIQLVGVIVSFLVVVRQIFTLLRDWRGGSPELRLLRRQIQASDSQWNESNEQLRNTNEQLINSNDRILQLLRRIVNRLDERG